MKIVKSNGKYTFYNKIEILDELEPKNYLLRYDIFGVYLEETTPLALPEKLYDGDKQFRQIVLKSFQGGSGNTGVLLEGYKGQGKTVTSKLLCIESKLPVIMIDKSVPIQVDFVSFLNNIEQEFILFVDEFEKVFKAPYDRHNDENDNTKNFHDQNAFLTLMDGALSNQYKKLFIFTTNDSVDDKFINRPSRIKWHKSYQYMPKTVYDMIISDKLKYPEFKEDLLKNLSIQDATIDLLCTIIDQINLLIMPYSEFKDVFNHSSKNVKYSLSYKVMGETHFTDLGEVTVDSKPVKDNPYFNGMAILEVKSISDDSIVFQSHNRHSKVVLTPEEIEEARVNGPYKPNKVVKQYIYKYVKVQDFVEKLVY